MAAPIDELNARISELKADLAFVALASQLRPRIGAVVQWQATGEVVDLATRFMNAQFSRPEGVYGPLLVRLVAAFERYLRKLVTESVEYRASRARTLGDLPSHLVTRNLALTGRLLSAVEAPRDHLTLDIGALVSNLASCTPGSSSFRLNAQAFSAVVSGVSPEVVEKCLANVGVPGCWDGVGASAALEKQLGTQGVRPTGDRARERLKEICRWRNNLAHGGDEEVSLLEPELGEAIDFVACFSDALDKAVKKHLKSH
jgi:hypothetical protein